MLLSEEGNSFHLEIVMRRTGTIMFGLTLGVLLLVILVPPESQPGTHTIERINGEVRSIEQYDENWQLHGSQRVYSQGQLIHERMVEHGQVLWSKDFDTKGTLTRHYIEGPDYNLIPAKDQTD